MGPGWLGVAHVLRAYVVRTDRARFAPGTSMATWYGRSAHKLSVFLIIKNNIWPSLDRIDLLLGMAYRLFVGLSWVRIVRACVLSWVEILGAY